MASDRRESARGSIRLKRSGTKEERKLFPVWTLIVIAGCAALWLFGAKLYQDRMAAYETYAAISKTAAQTTFFPGVTVDGDIPWIWLVNIDHLYWSREGLKVAEQKLHPHGHGWSIVNNVDQWSWE